VAHDVASANAADTPFIAPNAIQIGFGADGCAISHSDADVSTPYFYELTVRDVYGSFPNSYNVIWRDSSNDNFAGVLVFFSDSSSKIISLCA